jgi:hypothetical protein
MKEIEILQALINDVKGNVFLGDTKKASGYLKSMSLLADAMARRSWQLFELHVIDEIKEVEGSEKVAEALEVKAKLAKREFELADMQVKLMEFHASVASSAFVTKEDAANSLRKIVDKIAANESELFPKPWTAEELKAYAASIGATFIETKHDADAILGRQKLKCKNNKTPEKRKTSNAATAVWASFAGKTVGLEA